MAKFFADRGGPGSSHGGPLQWPGTADGFPFRGDVIPDLKDDEFANVQLALDYKQDVFRLWDPAEKAAFTDVMDRIVNGWYMQHKRIDRWSDDPAGLIVHLEWVQIYGETPRGKNPGAGHANQTVQQAPPRGTFGIVPEDQISGPNYFQQHPIFAGGGEAGRA